MSEWKASERKRENKIEIIYAFIYLKTMQYWNNAVFFYILLLKYNKLKTFVLYLYVYLINQRNREKEKKYSCHGNGKFSLTSKHSLLSFVYKRICLRRALSQGTSLYFLFKINWQNLLPALKYSNLTYI